MDDERYLLAADPDEANRYHVYKLASAPITPGDAGVPPDIVEWLIANGTVHAARLLPEQARALIEKAPTASLGDSPTNPDP